MTWLLIGAAASLVAGVRRSRYDGVPPIVWWRQERMHRRPLRIAVRLARVVVGAAVLVLAFAAALTVAAALLAGAAVAGVALLAWWRLRLAAAACAPPVWPVERDDLAAGEMRGEAAEEALKPTALLPPGTVTPETSGDEIDPHMHMEV